MNALFGAMRAAWKSTECGIAPSFVSVILTSCPWRTWITGPGAPPAHAQAAYLTPGAIWTVMSVRTRWTSATGPGWRRRQRRRVRLVRGCQCVGVRGRGAGVARQGAAVVSARPGHAGHPRHPCGRRCLRSGAACASSRALRASIHIISATKPSTATSRPSRSAAAPQRASESDVPRIVGRDAVICLLLCERCPHDRRSHPTRRRPREHGSELRLCRS